ncbi:MAG TPA: hypothetical protein PLO63_10815 [Syntrophales bacterium]|nr:hypothetical protein [Syntrophales bacterium]
MNVLSILRCACPAAAGMLLLPAPALANAGTGFRTASLVLLIWIALMIFSSLGGVYAIRKKRLAEKGRKRSLEGAVYTLVAALTVVISMATVETMILCVFAAAAVALVRAYRLFSWSKMLRKRDAGAPADEDAADAGSASGEKAVFPWLEGANPGRMLLASSLIVASTAILVPVTIAVGWQEGSYQLRQSQGQKIVKDFREFVAEEIRLRKQPQTGDARGGLLSLHARCRETFESRDYSRHRCELPSDLEAMKFTIHLVPSRASLFVPAISFRADESGKIRAAKVYSPGERCPADAQVVTDATRPDEGFYPLYSL